MEASPSLIETVESTYSLSSFEDKEVTTDGHGTVWVKGPVHVDKLPYELPESARRFVDMEGFVIVTETYIVEGDTVEMGHVKFSWE